MKKHAHLFGSLVVSVGLVPSICHALPLNVRCVVGDMSATGGTQLTVTRDRSSAAWPIRVVVREAGERGDEGNLIDVRGFVSATTWVAASRTAARILIFSDYPGAANTQTHAGLIVRFMQEVFPHVRERRFPLLPAIATFQPQLRGFVVFTPSAYSVMNTTMGHVTGVREARACSSGQ